MAVLITNNASSTLASSITLGATSLSVQTGDAAKFPSPSGGDWFPLTLVDAAGNVEIVRCTARAAAVLTIERAQEGLAARAFAAGSRVDLRITAGVFAGIKDTIQTDVLTAVAASYATDAELAAATTRATSAEILQQTTGKLIEADELFASAVAPALAGATGTVAFDFNGYINREITATGNIIFDVVSNAKPGSSGFIEIVHSGAARALSLNTTYWTTANGAALVLSSVASKRDVLAYYVLKSGKLLLSVAALGV
jgi:hypothetical protein